MLRHLRNPRLAATYTVGFCVMFTLLGTFTYVNFYLAAPPFHLSTAALGQLFAVYLVGAVITPRAGKMIDRMGHRFALVAAFSGGAAGVALTGVAFADTLPAGLVVATPNGLANTCGGAVTAVAGTNSISLTGGALAAGASCTAAVNITGNTAGVKNNTSGAVSSNETGAGAASNTATVTVVAPPTIGKAFTAASVPLNGTTKLTFTITNPNGTVALTGIGFTDNLPAGIHW